MVLDSYLSTVHHFDLCVYWVGSIVIMLHNDHDYSPWVEGYVMTSVQIRHRDRLDYRDIDSVPDHHVGERSKLPRWFRHFVGRTSPRFLQCFCEAFGVAACSTMQQLL